MYKKVNDLEQLKCRLDYLSEIALMKMPTIKHQMQELIKEGVSFKEFEHDKCNALVDAIYQIFNKDIDVRCRKRIKKDVEKSERLAEESLEFRFFYEQKYGENEAFNFIVEQFETYILETLKPIKKIDNDDKRFKREVLEHLEQAKRHKSINIEESWRCLFLIDRNIRENLNYFRIKVQEAIKDSWASKSPYQKFENEITELVKQVICGKIKKIDARREIWVLKNQTKINIKEVKSETFNNWITNYKKTGAIFEKPPS